MADTAISALNLKSVNQISWVVKDIDKTIEAWSSIYGMEPWEIVEFNPVDDKGRQIKVRVAFHYIGDMEIELVQCVEGRIFHSHFLDVWGEGVHHIGFHVDDVEATVKHLVAKGAKILLHDPGKFVYLDAGGPGGAIFEFYRKRK